MEAVTTREFTVGLVFINIIKYFRHIRVCRTCKHFVEIHVQWQMSGVRMCQTVLGDAIIHHFGQSTANHDQSNVFS